MIRLLHFLPGPGAWAIALGLAAGPAAHAGNLTLDIASKDQASRVFRRSLYGVEDIRSGEPFTDENVRSIRPGHGLSLRHLPEVLGRRASQDLARGTPLAW